MLNGLYNPQRWTDGQFAILLQRPFFLRYSTVILGVIAFVAALLVPLLTDPKQFALNALGYFLALWAVRSALSSAAPPGVPTYLDHGVLGLYLVTIGAFFLRLAIRS